MKKFYLILLGFVASSMMSVSANPDIKDLLKGLGGSGSNSDIVGGIGSVLNGVLSSSKISVKDVVGTWGYVDPAVEFKSENLLKKAGGAAASSAIVSKIKPYYEKAGVKNMQFVVNEDATFTLAIGKTKMSGTITEGSSDGQFIFNFKALGKINLGKITAYMSKNISGELTLTFDASKLISLVNTISSITSNSTIQGVSSLLNSYDGLTVGFLLKKK